MRPFFSKSSQVLPRGWHPSGINLKTEVSGDDNGKSPHGRGHSLIFVTARQSVRTPPYLPLLRLHGYSRREYRSLWLHCYLDNMVHFRCPSPHSLTDLPDDDRGPIPDSRSGRLSEVII